MTPRKMAATLTLAFASAIAASGAIDQGEATATIGQVQQELLRLPYYGVFDFLSFTYDNGTVTLAGYASTPTLSIDAQRAVERVAHVVCVVDRIEVLPMSTRDDDLRWNLFYAIYHDSFLSEESGEYPIHIIVRQQRITLLGSVHSERDRARAAAIAAAVSGTLAVDNALTVDAPDPPAQPPLPTPIPPPGARDAGPVYAPAELDRIVSPIALYPDPLLAQVLAAATFPDDIPDAARWADDHHYLTEQKLTDAIIADRVPWDPSVQALLPFPSVLEMMASAMPWTRELGSAFLVDRVAVMDAVQRMRRAAYGYGYLRSCAPVVVHDGPYVEILPASPAFIVVPYYQPTIVYVPPPPGFVLERAVYCGFGIRLGVWFAPWGWGTTRFVWATHTVIIHGAPWGRTWANRVNYVHPYAVPRATAPRPPDRHPPRPRTPAERQRERPKKGSSGRDTDHEGTLPVIEDGWSR